MSKIVKNSQQLLKIVTNSQKLRKLYEDIGFFYAGQPSVWLNNFNPIKKNSLVVKIPKIRAVDINNYEDLELAQILFKHKVKK